MTSPSLWQPIETAPKDDWFLGRWYAAGKDGRCSWVVVQMRVESVMAGYQYYETWDGRLLTSPTHWQPLPAPPETEREAME
ncbi:DUF551 domain-containing protein [Sinorhizobium medicae]|nr:DUF551 domain-containing protein [Sinorhizobium medicae]